MVLCSVGVTRINCSQPYRKVNTDRQGVQETRETVLVTMTLFLAYKELLKFVMFWKCQSKGKNVKEWFAEEQHGQQEDVFFPDMRHRTGESTMIFIWNSVSVNIGQLASWPGWASWAQSEDRQFRFAVLEDWGTAKDGEREKLPAHCWTSLQPFAYGNAGTRRKDRTVRVSFCTHPVLTHTATLTELWSEDPAHRENKAGSFLVSSAKRKKGFHKKKKKAPLLMCFDTG